MNVRGTWKAELVGCVLVLVVPFAAIYGLVIAADYSDRWISPDQQVAFERLVKSLLYIFGCWALIHGIYFLARVNTRRLSSGSKWETFKYASYQVGVIFATVAMIGLISGFGQLYIEKLFTLEGFVQAVIVVGVPAFIGVWIGLGDSPKESDPPNGTGSSSTFQ